MQQPCCCKTIADRWWRADLVHSVCWWEGERACCYVTFSKIISIEMKFDLLNLLWKKSTLFVMFSLVSKFKFIICLVFTWPGDSELHIAKLCSLDTWLATLNIFILILFNKQVVLRFMRLVMGQVVDWDLVEVSQFLSPPWSSLCNMFASPR